MIASEITAYCIGCDRVAFFDDNCHCYVCGCDHPAGEINDPDLDYEEYLKEVQQGEMPLFSAYPRVL